VALRDTEISKTCVGLMVDAEECLLYYAIPVIAYTSEVILVESDRMIVTQTQLDNQLTEVPLLPIAT
jgi:hypothetical protein